MSNDFKAFLRYLGVTFISVGFGAIAGLVLFFVYTSLFASQLLDALMTVIPPFNLLFIVNSFLFVIAGVAVLIVTASTLLRGFELDFKSRMVRALKRDLLIVGGVLIFYGLSRLALTFLQQSFRG